MRHWVVSDSPQPTTVFLEQVQFIVLVSLISNIVQLDHTMLAVGALPSSTEIVDLVGSVPSLIVIRFTPPGSERTLSACLIVAEPTTVAAGVATSSSETEYHLP